MEYHGSALKRGYYIIGESDLPALKGWHVHKKMCPEKL
jgi:hypothetical protein